MEKQLTVFFKAHIDNAAKSEDGLWDIITSPVGYRKSDNAE